MRPLLEITAATARDYQLRIKQLRLLFDLLRMRYLIVRVFHIRNTDTAPRHMYHTRRQAATALVAADS